MPGGEVQRYRLKNASIPDAGYLGGRDKGINKRLVGTTIFCRKIAAGIPT